MPKQLPDTPWHIGSPKMKESDHRRLNKWCVHYDSSFCTEPKSGCYMLKCAGSSHCRFYAEDDGTSRKIQRDNRSQAEIDAEQRRRYIETLKPRMHELVDSLDDRRYRSVQSLATCYICGRKLLNLGKLRKQCTLCHMEYVDQISWLTDNKSMDGRFVYVMGREKTATTSDGRKVEHNQNARQLKANKFTGVQNVPISSIVVGNMTTPRQCKIDSEVKKIQLYGGVITPVYVGISGDKYLLKEGYVRYLAASQCGLTSIPVTLEWKYARKK